MSWYCEWWCKGRATRAPPPGPFRSCCLLWRGLSQWLTFANFLPLVRGSLRTVKGWRLWVGVQVNDGACWDEESSHRPRRNNQGSGEQLKEMLEWKWHLCRLSFCNPAIMLVLILDLFHQSYKSWSCEACSREFSKMFYCQERNSGLAVSMKSANSSFQD